MILLLLPAALASTVSLELQATWEGDPEDGDFPGVSLAVGDVNGDGTPDSVLTSPGYDDNRGRILLFSGHPDGLEDSTPQSIAGLGATDELGAAVAAVGDVDGDGFDDLAVGLPGAGEVWILRGSADGLEDSPWLTLTGPAGTSRFGQALDNAGDVDADGTLDLVVSAQDEAEVTGLVFLCLGSEGLDPEWAVALEDTGGGHYFGASVAGAGDVDGDGYDDVVVGDYTYGGGYGAVLLFFGGEGGIETTASWRFENGDDGTTRHLGETVLGGADYDGDGYDDLLFAAPGYTDYRGRAYVVPGAPGGPDTSAMTRLKGDGAYEYFGESLAQAGDVNGDGYPDVVVGAWAASDASGEATGRAYLALGGAEGVKNADRITMEPPIGGYGYGWRVGGMGDTDGDGRGELFVGMSYGDDSLYHVVFVYPGSTDSPGATTPYMIEKAFDDDLGSALAGMGDVNGDGLDDFLLTSPRYALERGLVELFLGSDAGDRAEPAWTRVGAERDQRLGRDVAGVGDIDGDGLDDLAVASNGTASTWPKVEIFLGAHDGPGDTPSATLTPCEAVDDDWITVAGAGDVDGDGYDDIIIGLEECGEHGQAFLYRGSAEGVETTPAGSVSGEASGGDLGRAVTGAGDVNGDGYDDVAVSDTYVTLDSAVYVFLGGPDGLDTTPAVVLRDTGDASTFGQVLSGPTDLNGDGYGDLVVGSYDRYGLVEAFMGSASGLSTTAAWRLEGGSFPTYQGWGLTTADVDGDGYDDVVVGSPSRDLYKVPRPLQVFRGGPDGPADRATWTWEPTDVVAAEDFADYGQPLAGAGDVDGDGLDEVLVTCSRCSSGDGQVFLVGLAVDAEPGDTGDDTGSADGGAVDGGTSDGGTSDGGTSDGGASDGGGSDGGTTDGGTTDGGTSDGGTSDGGTSDGGTTDGGAGDTAATGDGGGSDTTLDGEKTGCASILGAWGLLGLLGATRRRTPGGRRS